MALPAKVNWITFDVYGTLIDWEAGINAAFQNEAQRDGFTLENPEAIFPRFLELQHEVQSGSYELYAEVLRRCAVTIAKELEWPLEPSRAGFLPASLPRWRPFKETNTQLARFGKKFQTGLVANIDDKLLGETRRHIPHNFDLVVTAQVANVAPIDVGVTGTVADPKTKVKLGKFLAAPAKQLLEGLLKR